MNALGYGLLVTLIGLAVVFVALVLLIILVMAMTTILEKKKKPSSSPAVEAAAETAAEISTPEVEMIDTAADSDESEVVAAIMSAINCMYAGSDKRPVVRSVRRSSAGWSRAFR